MPVARTTLGDFLTDEQIKECLKLKHAGLICEKIIEPNIDVINMKLHQENVPMYLAYAVEYAIRLNTPLVKIK